MYMYTNESIGQIGPGLVQDCLRELILLREVSIFII